MLHATVAALAAVTAALGLWGLVSPAGIKAFAARWRSAGGLWAAASLRLVFGLALWLVAPSTVFPVTLRLLAVLAIAAAVALPLMGVPRYHSLIGWWIGRSDAFVRTWSAIAAAVGIMVIWAVLA
jgi:hypothetical protein